MTIEKRGRGRAIGSGLDDRATRARMVDLILANPALLPTTALKRVVRALEPSFIRRLQVKWKASAPRHLAEARARRLVTRTTVPPLRKAIPSRGRTLSPLEQAHADLGFGVCGQNRRSESIVERAVREAKEQIQSLVGGRGSSTARAIREAREGSLPGAGREAAVGIEGNCRSDGLRELQRYASCRFGDGQGQRPTHH